MTAAGQQSACLGQTGSSIDVDGVTLHKVPILYSRSGTVPGTTITCAATTTAIPCGKYSQS